MRIAVLGGDARQWEAAQALAAEGHQVRVFGLKLPGEGAGGPGLTAAASPAEALAGAQAVVGPVQGATATGAIWVAAGLEPVVLSHEDLAGLEPAAVFLIGVANSPLRRLCREAGVELVEYREEDDFALLNAIPSAEGAIAMAMERTPFTLFGSRCFILGFGRTGEILALMLRGLGARTTVAARKPAALARARAHGHQAVPFDDLERALPEAQVVFNTVPAPVLFGRRLESLPAEAVVIDLASAPGGVDFARAGERGMQAVLAPGLPGKVAPKSAGLYVAGLVVRTLNSRSLAGR